MNEKFKVGEIELPVNKDTTYELVVPKKEVYLYGDEEEHKVMEEVMVGVKLNMPILLTGPTGCGKTSLIRYLAQETHNPYRRIQLTGATGVDDFKGKHLINAQGTFWVDGPLTEAVRRGYYLLLDELNAANPEILFVLHQLMDNENVLTLEENGGEIIVPHPNFRLFAAINPPEDYVGTKELNRALVDRFPIVIDMQYPDNKKEQEIIEAHTGVKITAESDISEISVISRMVDVANAIRLLNASSKIIFACSTRQLIFWTELSKIFDIKKASEIVMVNKASYDERDKIRTEINKAFRDGEHLKV